MLVEFKIFYYDKGWTARATDHGIITEGETIGELVDNIIEATELYFEGEIERKSRSQSPLRPNLCPTSSSNSTRAIPNHSVNSLNANYRRS